MNKIKRILSGSFVPALALVLAVATVPATALAKDAYLKVQQFDKEIRDGSGDGSGMAIVKMWGYADCHDDDTFTTCDAPTSPGPDIRVPAGESLTIHLQNELPALSTVTNSTSVIIPALPKALSPVRWPDTGSDPSRDNRIYSFDAITTSPGTGDYTWDTTASPGTYLYHSGTHPQVQVQMGLYGAVIVESATGSCTGTSCAYPDVGYDQEKVLVFSEVDPALHEAVAMDKYDNPACNPDIDYCPTSTEKYSPRFFLINGAPFYAPESAPIITTGDNTESILLRMVNAGIENHAPQLLGGYFDVIAEDGKRAPTSRSQHTMLLPAGKSKDIIFQPTENETVYTLFDRRLRTVNDTGLNGGIFANINVGVYSCPGCVNFTDNNVSYSAAQDPDMDVTLFNGGFGITLAGNTIRRTLSSYTVTPYTVIEFTYSSTAVGEVQAIWFDDDQTKDPTHVFQLAGTQNYGNRDFAYTGGGAPQDFSIPVGQYYTGTGLNLIVENDHDAGPANSNGTFENVRIFELAPAPTAVADVNTAAAGGPNATGNVLSNDLPTSVPATVIAASHDGTNILNVPYVIPGGGGTITLSDTGAYTYQPPAAGSLSVGLTLVFDYTMTNASGVPSSSMLTIEVAPDLPPVCTDCVNFTGNNVSFSSSQDQDMDVTLFDGGYGITLAGNTHRRTLTSYTITPYTVIEFTYSSTAVGEVQGLGFESDTSLSSNRIFKLQGTQNWAISGFTYTGAGAPQSFTIPVGQYYTGTGMNLVLSNDHDAGVANSNGTFTNVRIYESVPPPIMVDFTGNHESFSASQDEDMDATVINGGAGLALAGNTHRRTLTSYTITPYTVIEFTYSSTAVGEVQGLGFESDSSISSNRIFRLAGTQNWGINDFVYTGAGAPQSFSIPVGTYYTGSGMNLVLSNDHDAGVANSNGTFTNVRILEVVPPGP